MTQGSLGVEQFSLYEGRPVQFRTGQTAVFLPTELTAQARRELFEAFCEVHPRLVEPSHGG
ncbi:hypothetical protein [Arenimonas sp. MALMAid1274]|uniref:hypothetical protein n=1 Tax=Arenimonas sp. MALMAid1274 TaxID=3411630 RepID=UPI003BA1F7B4